MHPAKDVDAYVEASPIDVQPKLREIRAIIREVAPDAVESISYGMPFYSYQGESGFKARLCYFGLLKGSVGLYLRPPVIEEHMDELAGYKTTKSVLKIPLNRPIPVALIRRLVREEMRNHEAEKVHRRARSTKRKAGHVT
jgi:uncharacterized protein YdhG (YjbR/CyaY superfamily)